MGAGPELDGKKIDDVPLLAEIRGQALDGVPAASEHLDESPGTSEHVLVDRVAAAGGQRRVDRADGRVGPHILAGPAVRAGRQPAHGDRRDPQRVRHLLVGELEELCRSDGAAERDDLRGVDAAASTAARLADPARRLVAHDHRAEQLLPGGAGALADGQTGRCERGPFVGGVADVAVIRCGRIAEHGVDPRGRRRGTPFHRTRSSPPACRRAPSPGRGVSVPSRSAHPGAALANVLARIIFACSIAFGGRSPYFVLLRNRASARALSGGAPAARPVPRLPGKSRARHDRVDFEGTRRSERSPQERPSSHIGSSFPVPSVSILVPISTRCRRPRCCS